MSEPWVLPGGELSDRWVQQDSEIIEDNRREKETAPSMKGDLPERHSVPEDNPYGVSEELPPPTAPKRISKLKFK